MCRYIFIAWSNGPHLLAQLFHSREALATAAANENVKPEESPT